MPATYIADNSSNYAFAGGVLGNTARGNGMPSAGQRVTAAFGGSTVVADSASAMNGLQPGTVEHAAAVGATGNPIASWVAMAAMLLAVMWAARHFGNDSDYANPRLTVYTLFTTTFTAMVGIVLVKTFLTKFPIPGFTTIARAV